MRWSDTKDQSKSAFHRKKVTVVGAGNVGATAAFLAADRANAVLPIEGRAATIIKSDF